MVPTGPLIRLLSAILKSRYEGRKYGGLGDCCVYSDALLWSKNLEIDEEKGTSSVYGFPCFTLVTSVGTSVD